GKLRIAISEDAPTDSKSLSTVIPYPAHPLHIGEGPEFIGYKDYDVPVPDRSTGGAPGVVVDFRSTLKKFQVRWASHEVKGIVGKNVVLKGIKGGANNIVSGQ